MREDLISPHPASLPFPWENGERVSSPKLSTSEELFQNVQTVCTCFWSRSNFLQLVESLYYKPEGRGFDSR